MVLYFVSCNYPKFVIIVLVPQNLFMFALFTDFYIKAYVKKKTKVPSAIDDVAQKKSLASSGGGSASSAGADAAAAEGQKAKSH